MVTSSELSRLLSLVAFDPRFKVVEGIDAFRNLLEKDADGQVLRFLKRHMGKLEGRERAVSRSWLRNTIARWAT